jgi:multidrug transporter EmrE-like cation transporter
MEHNLYVIIASLTAISTAFLIKKYTKTHENIYIILTIIAYLILLITYIKIFSEKEVSTMYTILQIIQILIIIIIGFIFFDEKLNTTKVIGFGSGILSVYLLNKN